MTAVDALARQRFHAVVTSGADGGHVRRLLLAMVLLATGVAVLPAGARPVRLPYRVPGSVVLEHAASPRAWLEEQYQHLAGLGDVAKQVLARYDRAMAAQAGTIEWEGVYETGDLDGDGVFELMKYHTRAEIDAISMEGWTDFDIYSGRTGARRWGIRWSRTCKGSRPNGTRPSRSGRTVACR